VWGVGSSLKETNRSLSVQSDAMKWAETTIKGVWLAEVQRSVVKAIQLISATQLLYFPSLIDTTQWYPSLELHGWRTWIWVAGMIQRLRITAAQQRWKAFHEQ
jgi:hypothetical protein